MGGAINLVTRKPTLPLELNGKLGWLSGGRRAHINAGSRLGKFYVQLGLSHYKRDHFPLSGRFNPTDIENGGDRDNAYHGDNKLSFKLGFVPNQRSEYSIGYIRQHGEKGTPVYTGRDTLNSQFSKPRFWQWPYWNKESLYFISRTGLGNLSYFKTRIFYDSFGNELNSYDDAAYTTQDRPYAFKSIYDDHTIGAALEYGTSHFHRHFLKAVAHYKKDVHQEYGPEDPRLEMADYTLSFGIEDAVTLSEKLQLNAGLSYNSRNNIRADNYNPDTEEITPFPSGLSHALNGQVSLSYRPDSSGAVFLSLARKTRFATIKDRYSYRMGTAMPNPGLKPENALNLEIGLERMLTPSITARPVLFYSQLQDAIQMVDNAVYDQESEQWLAQQQNAGEAVFYGAELQLGVQISERTRAGLNYTFIERENRSDPLIKFTDVPQHKIFTYAEYQFIKSASVLGSFEYNSDRYSTSYGTIAPDYILVNLKARAPVWKYISLEAGVNNLLDQNYAYAEGYPEPGRNFYVNLEFNY